jgi:membrane protease YdiL (CAAX protease family)
MAPSCHDPAMTREVVGDTPTHAMDPIEAESVAARAWRRFTAAPAYPATAADLRTVSIVGAALPVRAGIAVAVATFAVLFDYSRTFIPDSIQALGFAPEAMRFQSIERAILFLVVPLAVVALVFRDRPSRYGLTLGEWRWGAALAVVGCLLMTPVVLWLASIPEFRAYYAPSAASPPDLVLTHTLDLFSAEFLLRGFLMFPLLRLIGPFALLVATMPFVFAHLGKPEIELFSTLFGGLVYAWVDWRTRSIVWSTVAHVYIVTLLVLLAAG